MDEREHRKRKERSNTIWTFIIIGAFLAAWPIGLVLAILKGKDLLPPIGMHYPAGGKEPWRETQAKQTAQEQARYWAEKIHRQTQQAKAQAAQWAAPVQPEKKSAKKSPKKPKKLRFGKGMFITGLSLGALGLLTLADELSYVMSLGDFLRDCFFSLGLLAVGIYLTVYGLMRTRQSKRLLEYADIIRPNGGYFSIHELADRTGRPYKQVLADLQKMVELDVWEQAWIDRKHGRLMFTDFSAAPEPEPHTEAAAEPSREDTRAEQVLQRIRADNDLIDDPVISQKIDRIELLTGEIFRYLAKHPEREGELRTFMDYYLPQTLKILETYAHLEAQGVETENIRKAKEQIGGMLDQLIDSYERQLDKLFHSDVLDISADIEVMRQMLRSDGLSPDGLELELKTERQKRG